MANEFDLGAFVDLAKLNMLDGVAQEHYSHYNELIRSDYANNDAYNVRATKRYDAVERCTADMVEMFDLAVEKVSRDIAKIQSEPDFIDIEFKLDAAMVNAVSNIVANVPKVALSNVKQAIAKADNDLLYTYFVSMNHKEIATMRSSSTDQDAIKEASKLLKQWYADVSSAGNEAKKTRKQRIDQKELEIYQIKRAKRKWVTERYARNKWHTMLLDKHDDRVLTPRHGGIKA